jgi:hypothetical protein
MTDPNATAWTTALLVLGIGATAGAFIAFVAGLVAGSLLNSPMQAVLLGLVLGVIPVGIAGFLTGLFPFAVYRWIPVGAVVPALLLIGYVFGSFYALCRGEPAGRRRWLRGIVPVGVALIAIPLAFVVSAPLAMRLEAGRLDGGASLAPARAGRLAVVIGRGGIMSSSGWLFDIDSGNRARFLPPPVGDAVWNPDGSLLAVVNAAGTVGGYSMNPKVDFYDAEGRLLRTATSDYETAYIGGIRWGGRYVVSRTSNTRESSGLVLVSADTGEIRDLIFDQPFNTWSLLGPTRDGTLYVLRLREHPSGARTIALQRLNVEAARLDPEILLEEEGFMSLSDQEQSTYFWVQGLSPEGRFLVRSSTSALDLETGEEVTLHSRRRSAWLNGDLLAWLKPVGEGTHLFVGQPGTEGERIRSWNEGVVFIEASPDHTRLLVKVYRDKAAAETPEWGPMEVEYDEMIETWIYDLSSGSWSEARGWFDDGPPEDNLRIRWAGPATLAQVGKGRLVLVGLRAPEERRYVFGSP